MLKFNVKKLLSNLFTGGILFSSSALAEVPQVSHSLCEVYVPNGNTQVITAVHHLWHAIANDYKLKKGRNATTCGDLKDYLRSPTDQNGEYVGIYLNLSDLELTDQIYQGMFQSVHTSFPEENPGIVGLDVSRNHLTAQVWKNLALNRRHNLLRNLMYLNISKNKISENWSAYFRAIPLRDLTILDASYNKIHGDIDPNTLGLGENYITGELFLPKLVYLDLSHNNIYKFHIETPNKVLAYFDFSYQLGESNYSFAFDLVHDGEVLFDLYHLGLDNLPGFLNLGRVETENVWNIGSLSMTANKPFGTEFLYARADFIDLRGRESKTISDNTIDSVKKVWKNNCSDAKVLCSNKGELPLGGCKFYDVMKTLEDTLVEEPEETKRWFAESLKDYEQYCEG